MTKKRFSSKALLGTAIIATIVAWMVLFGFTIHTLWIVIPLAFWAWSRKHLSEKARLASEAGIIGVACAILIFVLFSFLLPDSFMPWTAVSFVAVVPALIIAATLFFVLTRPVSPQERIHELEALTFLVIIVLSLVIALPQLVLVSTLPPNYAYLEATSDYWSANQVVNQPLVSNSSVPEVLVEYSQGYLEELSALISFWQNNPPDRCITCVVDSQTILKKRSLNALFFATTARQVDRYSVMLDENPELFSQVEECVLQAPLRAEYEQITRPSQARSYAITPFGAALERYEHHTDFYLAGFVSAEQVMLSATDAQIRAVEIARVVAQTPEENRVINLVDEQRLREVFDCGVIY